MTDPLSDPRARDLIAAVPGELGNLASGLAQAAGDSALTAHGLSAVQQDPSWTGPAADAFRGSLARVPRQLGRIQSRLAIVSTALAAYEDGLVEVRAAFVRTVARLADAEARASSPLPAGGWEGEVERLRALAARLLDEFDALRADCRGRIASADGA